MFNCPVTDDRFCIKLVSFGAGFLFACASIFAGNENYPAGARSSGLSSASVTLTDVWSSYNNQAGLAYLKLPTIGAFFENKFLVKEYSLQAGVFAYPAKPGTICASVRYFGYSKYHEAKAGLGFGRKLSKRFAVGVQIDYLQTYIAEGYGNYNAAVAEIGLLAEPVDNLFVGFHLFNPARVKNRTYPDEKIPTVVRFGIGYHFGEKATFLFETEKDVDQNPIFKGGLEISAIDKLQFRVGYASVYEQFSIGLGYQYQNFMLDLAFSEHPILGFTPHASIGYEF